MKGVWSNCKLAEEQLFVETTTASVFRLPAPLAASLPTFEQAGAVVYANSRTSNVSFLKPQQVSQAS